MSVSWNQIVVDHGEMVFRSAYRVLRDDGDAEDITQEVLLEAYRKHQTQGTVPEPGLLRRMATVRAIDRLRRRKPVQSLDDVIAHDERESLLMLSEQQEQMSRLKQALATLPRREAECFLLRYVEGASNRDIAKMLNTTETAISTALHKARTKLRQAMELHTDCRRKP